MDQTQKQQKDSFAQSPYIYGPDSQIVLPPPSEPSAPPPVKPHRWYRRKKMWAWLIVILLSILATAWFIEPTRLWIINALGAKVGLSIATQATPAASQPAAVLKRVNVTVNGQVVTTDDKGMAHANVPYGSVAVTATKQGYQTANYTADYDINPFFYLFNLGNKKADQAATRITLQLKSVGVPLSFKVLDWLTGAPVTTGQFSVGDIVAKPNNQGVVSLTLPPSDSRIMQVKASFSGLYNDKVLDVKTYSQSVPQEFIFTPGGKDYFVSKRSGVFSVWSCDLDGTNPLEVVKGTGSETAATAVSVSPSGKYLAVASSRDGRRDATNTVMQKLYIVNLSSGQLTAADQGQFISFADWSGDTLVYTLGEYLPKATSTTQRLSSLDIATGKKADLSAADYFNAVRVSLGSVVYELGYSANAPEQAATSPELRTIPVKGGTEKSLGYKVGTIVQSDATFVYQTIDNAWHSFDANTQQVGNTSAPASLSRVFVNTASADGQNRLVLDRIDGKTTLLVKNIANGQEKQLLSAPGLGGPVRWVGNVALFRVVDATQSADYIVPPTGTPPKKVADITASSGAFVATPNYIPLY